MSTTKRLIAACTVLTLSFAAFALPASAKTMVERNKPHYHHHHYHRNYMMHRHGWMHRHGMYRHHRMMHRPM